MCSCFRAMLIHTGCGKAVFSYACWGEGGGAQNGEEVTRGKSRRAGANPCLDAGWSVCVQVQFHLRAWSHHTKRCWDIRSCMVCTECRVVQGGAWRRVSCGGDVHRKLLRESLYTLIQFTCNILSMGPAQCATAIKIKVTSEVIYWVHFRPRS